MIDETRLQQVRTENKRRLGELERNLRTMVDDVARQGRTLPAVAASFGDAMAQVRQDLGRIAERLRSLGGMADLELFSDDLAELRRLADQVAAAAVNVRADVEDAVDEARALTEETLANAEETAERITDTVDEVVEALDGFVAEGRRALATRSEATQELLGMFAVYANTRVGAGLRSSSRSTVDVYAAKTKDRRRIAPWTLEQVAAGEVGFGDVLEVNDVRPEFNESLAGVRDLVNELNDKVTAIRRPDRARRVVTGGASVRELDRFRADVEDLVSSTISQLKGEADMEGLDDWSRQMITVVSRVTKLRNLTAGHADDGELDRAREALINALNEVPDLATKAINGSSDVFARSVLATHRRFENILANLDAGIAPEASASIAVSHAGRVTVAGATAEGERLLSTLSDLGRHDAPFADAHRYLIRERTELAGNLAKARSVWGDANLRRPALDELAERLTMLGGHQLAANAMLHDAPTTDAEHRVITSSLTMTRQTIEAIQRLEIAMDELDMDTPAVQRLRLRRRELERSVRELDRLDHAGDWLGDVVTELGQHVRGVRRTLVAVIGGMGLGGLAGLIGDPLRKVADVFRRYETLGRSDAAIGMVDAAYGTAVDRAHADRISFGMGQELHHLTGGVVGFERPTELYVAMRRGVGGRRGISAEANRAEAEANARNAALLQAYTGSGDATMVNFYTAFYRDARLSSAETAAAFGRLTEVAHASGAPMETLLTTVTSLTTGMRELGVGVGHVMGAMTVLMTERHLRVEDAASIVQATGRATQQTGNIWGRSMLFHVATGKAGSMWESVRDNMLSHNADGSVREGYYDNLVDQLFDEIDLVGGMYGADVGLSQGLVAVNDLLKERGYQQRDRSMITSILMSGDKDRLREQLKAIDKLNDPGTLPEILATARTALEKARGQDSEVNRINALVDEAINETAHNLKIALGGPLASVREWADGLMNRFTGFIDRAIVRLGGFLSSGAGRWVLDKFAEHPILTGMAVVGGGALAVGAFTGAVGALGSLTGAVLRTGVGRAVVGVGALAGTAWLMTDSTEAEVPDLTDDAANVAAGGLPPATAPAGESGYAAMRRMFADGSAVIRPTDEVEYEATKRALGFGPVIAAGGAAATGMAGYAVWRAARTAQPGGTSWTERFKGLGRSLRGAKGRLAAAGLVAGLVGLGISSLAGAMGRSTDDATPSPPPSSPSPPPAKPSPSEVMATTPVGERTLAGRDAQRRTDRLRNELDDHQRRANDSRTGTVVLRDEVETYEDMATKLQLSNDELMDVVRRSLAEHGLRYEQLTAQQRADWLKLFNLYETTYGSILQAARSASAGVAVDRSAIERQVLAEFDGDDATKGSWFERRGKELAGTDPGKSSEYAHIANYYYHSQDAASSEYWQNEAQNLTALGRGEGGPENQKLREVWERNWADFTRRDGGSHSGSLGTATAEEIRRMILWLAGERVTAERGEYVKVVGEERYQAVVKAARPSMQVIDAGALDIRTVRPYTKEAMLAALQRRRPEATMALVDMIIAAAQKNGIDPVFFMSSLILEGGSINNLGNVENYESGERFGDFANVQEGLDQAAGAWAAEIGRAGTGNMWKTANIYAPQDESQGNRDYVPNVTAIMNEIYGQQLVFPGDNPIAPGENSWIGNAGDNVPVTPSGQTFAPAPSGQGTQVQLNGGADALEQGYQRYAGVTMDNGTVGCVEAATKIGAFYNPFLKGELDKGVLNVGVLTEHARAAGLLQAYNGQNVQRGDVLVYGDYHVNIADGAGGIYGNSSGRNMVVHDESYYEDPTYVIKTGSGSLTALPGAVGALPGVAPAKPSDPFTDAVAAQRRYDAVAKAMGYGDRIEGGLVNGMYVSSDAVVETADEIRANAVADLRTRLDDRRATVATAANVQTVEDLTLELRLAHSSFAASEQGETRVTNFDKIMMEIEEIVKEFMDDPKIVVNCDY